MKVTVTFDTAKMSSQEREELAKLIAPAEIPFKPLKFSKTDWWVNNTAENLKKRAEPIKRPGTRYVGEVLPNGATPIRTEAELDAAIEAGARFEFTGCALDYDTDWLYAAPAEGPGGWVGQDEFGETRETLVRWIGGGGRLLRAFYPIASDAARLREETIAIAVKQATADQRVREDWCYFSGTISPKDWTPDAGSGYIPGEKL